MGQVVKEFGVGVLGVAALRSSEVMNTGFAVGSSVRALLRFGAEEVLVAPGRRRGDPAVLSPTPHCCDSTPTPISSTPKYHLLPAIVAEKGGT